MDLSGRRVLVTGGCGTIGSHLVRRILEQDPHSIRVLDTNEQALFDLERSLPPSHQERIRPLLGDIRDRDRLTMATDDIDVVFHAAALKHVELNEYNPFEAVKTNVQGTQNVISVAIEEEVDAVIGISTDKASNPVSVMGATKLLAERLIVAANTYKGNRETKFGCVRFGNVLGSSGSVVPVFLDQIEAGGPITVTNPEMTRFIMSVDRAVDLILKSGDKISGGEVYVLKMPAFKLQTLAEALKDRFAPEFGYETEDIEIEVVGPRPGERTHEKLISNDELAHTTELEEMFVVLPQIERFGYEEVSRKQTHTLSDEYTAADAEKLTKEEIIELVESSETVSLDHWL